MQAQSIVLNEMGRFTNADSDGLEIVAYDSATSSIFITNPDDNTIDIIDVSDVNNPSFSSAIALSSYGAGVNSVAVINGSYIAVAVEASPKQNPGKVVFFTTTGTYVADVTVGALPDMVAVNPAGTMVVTANEGEPNNDYTVDPEGSISVIDITGGVMNVSQSDVTTYNFASLNDDSTAFRAEFGLLKPGTLLQYDLEPEYITFASTFLSEFIFAVCQENNAVVALDPATGLIDFLGLGYKDHSIAGNGFDASNEDGGINIQTHNVRGLYQPDAVATYYVNGTPYIVSANEGDAREYDGNPGYISETRVKDLTLDATAYPSATIQNDDELGRLKTLTPDMIGDTDGDGDVDQIYSYGARSFTIWDPLLGTPVYDSGDEFEQYIAANHPDFFNCNDGIAAEKDDRSDDKGPEPEALTVGTIGDSTYAFIGLERQGGIMVYNITDPANAHFETFANSYDNANGTMADIAPEGIVFVPAAESHSGTNLLIVSNEVSGTAVVYEVAEIAVSDNEVAPAKAFKIFPNPTNQDIVNFETVETVTVYDVLGNQVARVLNSQTINTNGWATGTYIFVTDNGATQRFVKF